MALGAVVSQIRRKTSVAHSTVIFADYLRVREMCRVSIACSKLTGMAAIRCAVVT
jgi:hypothetical protein